MGDEVRVLEVLRIVEGVPVASGLDEGEGAQAADAATGVAQRHEPDLGPGAEGDEIARLAGDVRVLRRDDRVAGAVAALAGERLRRLSHRLPGGAPDVVVVDVAQVDELAGHVGRRRVEAEAGEASLGGGAVECVAGGVVGDERAEFRAAQVVLAQGRGVSGRVMTYSRFSLSNLPNFMELLVCEAGLACAILRFGLYAAISDEVKRH